MSLLHRVPPQNCRQNLFWFRFFHHRKSFSHDELVQMLQIDYDREMVFVALFENGCTDAPSETWGPRMD